jgi:beta-aspartyl-peptidase (threonine type)
MVEVFPDAVLVVHGGAGTIRRSDLTPERDAVCRQGLAEALRAGQSSFESGGSALDVVEAAVRVLEDNPLFNAGRGAVLDASGVVSMDAAVMRGDDRAAGAVSGVRSVRNPVLAARLVMENTPHVLLAGDGADDFAVRSGLEIADPDYFRTEERVRQLEIQRARGTVSLSEDNKFGTVGAAARDGQGGLAAATSTGGMTNKMPGRVGDTPVIGAGTWAENRTCALSATGHGEHFLRCAAAHAVHARMELAGLGIGDALAAVVDGVLVDAGGDGGIIGIAADGTAALSFNCPGMYRGVLFADGTILTGIYSDPCA